MSWGASHAVTFFNACLQIHLTHRVGYWVSESYVPYGLCNFCAAEKFLLSCTVLLCQALANLVVNRVLVPFSEVLLQWYTMLGDRDVKLGQCLTKLIESCLKLHMAGTGVGDTAWHRSPLQFEGESAGSDLLFMPVFYFLSLHVWHRAGVL